MSKHLLRDPVSVLGHIWEMVNTGHCTKDNIVLRGVVKLGYSVEHCTSPTPYNNLELDILK